MHHKNCFKHFESELLLNVRSGVQHLADKLDFVDGKVDPDSVPDSPVPASDQPDDIIKQISHILSRSGNLFVHYTIFISSPVWQTENPYVR